MKKALLFLVAVLLVAGGIAYMTGIFKINAGANAGFCTVDDEIAQQERAAIDDAAMRFVRIVRSADPAQAYYLMTKEARAAMTPVAFGTSVGQLLRAVSPQGDAQVARTYLIRDKGTGLETRTVCGPLDNYRWAAVAIKPGRTQAHVEIAGHARNNGLAFSLWLLAENDGWHVQYFNIAISSIAGQTADDLLRRARQERDSGHSFDAAMLYAGAQSTIDRGRAFQTGKQQELREDAAKFQLPAELKGNAPFQWNMGGHIYSVAQVTIVGVQGKLGLIFLLPQTAWNGNDDANEKNKAFLNAFIAAHPDYTRDFSFLVARALKPDKSGGFGTVYQNGKGFG